MPKESYPDPLKKRTRLSAEYVSRGERHFGDGLSGPIVAARLQGYDIGTLEYVDVAVDATGNLTTTGGGGGGGAVSIADGSDVAQGARADASWSGSGNGTVISILKAIWDKLAGTLVVGDGGGSITVDGPLTDTQLRATSVPISDGGESVTVDGTVGVSGSVAVTGPLTDTQLRAVAVPVSGTVTANVGTGVQPISDNGGSLTVDAPVGTPAFVRLSDGAAPIATLPVSGPLTDTQLRATAVPVSGPLTDAQLRAAAVPVSGTVTANGPLTDAQLRATVVPADVTPAAPVAGDYLPVRLTDGSAFYSATGGSGGSTPLFTGYGASPRIPGAAATPQNLLSVENTAGSARHIRVRSLKIRTAVTAAQVVHNPWFHLTRIAVAPTGGSALTKQAADSALASIANITIRGGASADGTAAAITATAGALATRMASGYAQRLHTAVGSASGGEEVQELIDPDRPIYVRAGEFLLLQAVVAAAADNVVTRSYIVSVIWDEF